ncbi:MAG: hypothetical protein WAV23_01460 [Minisyncoccia bacterium]
MKELNKKGNDWKMTAMIFYAKTTAWIIIPALLSLFVKSFLNINSDLVFPILIGLSFGVSCFGIFKEIKNYQKSIESNGK